MDAAAFRLRIRLAVMQLQLFMQLIKPLLTSCQSTFVELHTLSKTFHLLVWPTWIFRMGIRVQHHLLVFRREDQESSECVLVKQEFGIPPVAKLGIMHTVVGVVTYKLSNWSWSCSRSLFVLLYSSYLSLPQSVYVAYYVVWQVPVSYIWSIFILLSRGIIKNRVAL